MGYDKGCHGTVLAGTGAGKRATPPCAERRGAAGGLREKNGWEWLSKCDLGAGAWARAAGARAPFVCWGRRGGILLLAAPRVES